MFFFIYAGMLEVISIEILDAGMQTNSRKDIIYETELKDQTVLDLSPGSPLMKAHNPMFQTMHD